VLASGDDTLTYQWRKNGANLSDVGNVNGSGTPSLTLTGVTIANNAGNYDVVVANGAGSITSVVATLSIVVSNATVSPYEAKLRSFNPVSYWRMNEANGSQYCYDYWGGNIVENFNVNLGVPGPLPPDFSGMEASNSGGQYDGFSAYGASSASLLNNRAQFSVIGWFNTAGPIGTRIGLFGQNDIVEFGFHGNGPDGVPQVGVFTPFRSAFLNQSTNVLPGVWYLIAAVGSGTNVSLLLASTNGSGGIKVLQSSAASTTANYGVSRFPFRIGGGGVLDAAGNFFTGVIDDVAIFDKALTSSDLSDLFGAALSGGDLPPAITVQPVSQTLYAGRNATFSVGALGSRPQFRWRTNGVPVVNGGRISGATTPTLTVSNIVASDAASYDIVITNLVGAITSDVATLTVITPTSAYENSVIALNPLAYYRLNENGEPTTGTVAANDYWGGHPGLYGTAAQNAFNGIAGPRPPSFSFEAANAALGTVASTPSSWATAPFGTLGTNNVTMCAWINPSGTQLAWSGLVVNRGGGINGGFNYNDQQMVGYTWNNNNANTYNFATGLVPPVGEWSLVAVVITPTSGTVYLMNRGNVLSATNAIAHTPDIFGNNWQIGSDNNSGNNDGSRTYNGLIDEVAIFNYSLTINQLYSLYKQGVVLPPLVLNSASSGGNLTLSWPYGRLLEATNVTGPYLPNGGTSPYTTPETADQKYYRVVAP